MATKAARPRSILYYYKQSSTATILSVIVAVVVVVAITIIVIYILIVIVIVIHIFSLTCFYLVLVIIAAGLVCLAVPLGASHRAPQWPIIRKGWAGQGRYKINILKWLVWQAGRLQHAAGTCHEKRSRHAQPKKELKGDKVQNKKKGEKNIKKTFAKFFDSHGQLVKLTCC